MTLRGRPGRELVEGWIPRETQPRRRQVMIRRGPAPVMVLGVVVVVVNAAASGFATFVVLTIERRSGQTVLIAAGY